jgi:hypothetical protein
MVFRRGAGHSSCTWEAEEIWALTKSDINFVVTIQITLNYRADRWCSERVRGDITAPMLPHYTASIVNSRFVCFVAGLSYLLDIAYIPARRMSNSAS